MSKDAVRRFWTEHPLGSYESAHKVGSPEFFRDVDRIRADASRFAIHLYEFDASRGRHVLDVGCGSGWNTSQYAKYGAQVVGIDLSQWSAQLTTANLRGRSLTGHTASGDTEALPLRDESFDFVCCDGVLHHTAGTEAGLSEIRRVLRPGGRALISLYYENVLLRRPWFSIVKVIMAILRVRMHGSPTVGLRTRRADFVRWYDGADNPLGKIYSQSDANRIVETAGFKVLVQETHYFPLRFMPIRWLIPIALYRVLDRWFGTLTFIVAQRPSGRT